MHISPISPLYLPYISPISQVRVSEVHDGVSVASYSVDEFMVIVRALRDRCTLGLGLGSELGSGLGLGLGLGYPEP